MYAIVQAGGKQYRVQPGDQLKVEKMSGEPGTEVSLEQVLALATGEGLNLGSPYVAGASVSATVLRTARDRKIVVFKKKRRKAYHKKQGHRQWYTLLKINSFVTEHQQQETAPVEPEPTAVVTESPENS